jgi:tripartite-type tricarboxylate transporter receptor subunit TctC
MIVAPAKTPPAIVEALHRALMRVLELPEIKRQIINGGMLPMDNPSIEGLQDFVRSEIVRWAVVVRRAGLQGSE